MQPLDYVARRVVSRINFVLKSAHLKATGIAACTEQRSGLTRSTTAIKAPLSKLDFALCPCVVSCGRAVADCDLVIFGDLDHCVYGESVELSIPRPVGVRYARVVEASGLQEEARLYPALLRSVHLKAVCVEDFVGWNWSIHPRECIEVHQIRWK